MQPRTFTYASFQRRSFGYINKFVETEVHLHNGPGSAIKATTGFESGPYARGPDMSRYVHPVYVPYGQSKPNLPNYKQWDWTD